MSGFVRVGDGKDGARTVDESSCMLWVLRYNHCFADPEDAVLYGGDEAFRGA
jgi:hypothetical protein